MGCNSDYMNPNAKERNSKEAATLLVYVLEARGETPLEWVYEAANNYYGSAKDLNTLVAALCDWCLNMSIEEQERIIYDAHNPVARRLAIWWEAHKKADKERIEKERNEARKQELIESAKSKLTAEEIKALGLKL